MTAAQRPDRFEPITIDWDHIRLASPCDASWDQMSGDDKCRFCASCRKNVFDLTGLSREEAEETIRAEGGSPCVRLYRRVDGRLTTGDCRKERRRVGRARRNVARVAAVLLSLGTFSVAGAVVLRVTPESALAEVGSFTRKVQESILELRITLGIDPEPPQMVLGMICPDEFEEDE